MARDITNARLARCLLKESCLANSMPAILEPECPYGLQCEDGWFTVHILKKGGDTVAKEKTARRKVE